MNFTKQNNAERMAFVDKWAEYVRTHSDKDWSRQQNVIINSAILAGKSMTKEAYFKMKGVKTLKIKKKIRNFRVR